MMVASESVPKHLVRGLAGFGLLVLGIWLTPTFGGAVLLVPLALVVLRGCPVCWTAGLVTTIQHARRRRSEHTMAAACTKCTREQRRGAHDNAEHACEG